MKENFTIFVVVIAIIVLYWLIRKILKDGDAGWEYETDTTDETPAAPPAQRPVCPAAREAVDEFPATKEFFDSCQLVADKLFVFLRELDKDKRFVRFLNKNVKGIDSFDDYSGVIKNYNPRLAMLVILDLTNCVLQSGHDFSRPAPENFCAALFMARVTQPSVNMDYADAGEIWRSIVPTVVSMLDTMSGIRGDGLPPHHFYLETVFNTYNPEKAEVYRNMLLQFTVLVANADGSRSDAESRFLSGFKKKAATEAKPAAVSGATGISPFKSLDSLIGLATVKEEVLRLVNFIKIQKLREKDGLAVAPVSYHCVFSGNPGTGKTTVARILAGIYHELGVIPSAKLVETDRSGLVAEYVGQTAVKTNKIIDSALGGVLFVDEAYALTSGGASDYGAEAVATLLKRMEDNRDRLVVILAGYDDDMERFIESNPGLKSRFSRFLHFDDYNAGELMQIFESNLSRHQYVLAPDARDAIMSILEKAVAGKDRYFGNARTVRNLFERTLENQATRLASKHNLTRHDLLTITAADLASC